MNLLLWLNFCFITATGITLFWKLPPGREGGHGLTLWGLTRHEWGDIHAIAGLLFAVLVIAHLYLAWPWLKNAACKRRLRLVLAGLLTGLVIIIVSATGPVRQ